MIFTAELIFAIIGVAGLYCLWRGLNPQKPHAGNPPIDAGGW